MPKHEADFPCPRVFILADALQKLRAYVKACPAEINGFGIVKRVGNDFLISEVFILPQQVSAVSAKTDDAVLHEFIFKQVSQGQSPSEVKLQWHSHVDMEAYCSGEDRATISGYRCDFMISLVVNKREETFCRIDLFQPFRLGLAVLLEIFLPPDPALEESCAKEVEKKVEIIANRNISAGLNKLLKEIERLDQEEGGESNEPS